MRILAIGLLAGCGVVCAQISVDEGATHAKLVNDQTRVYLALNNGFSAPVAVRVRLEWLAPDGAKRHVVELPYNAPPGKSAVEARMGIEKRDDPLLYRLRYSVIPDRANLTAFSPKEGILSFPHIAEHAFILTGVGIGVQPRVGAPYEFRIFASHPITNRPVPGVVVSTDEADGASATTDANGEAVLRFKPDPEDWDSPGSITVAGRLGDLKRTAEIWHPPVDTGRARIYTDKPLYQPGQTAHIRILAIGGDGKARSDAEYRIRILDKDSSAMQASTVTTSRFGIAHIDWEIPSNAVAAKYRIEADDEDDPSPPASREIEVRRYELPSFRVTAQPDRPFYLPGQKPAIEVHADYLFGKPVGNGIVRVSETDDEKAILEGRLDAQGRFRGAVKLEQDAGDLGDSRFIDLHYTAYVTDSTTNRTEQRQFDIRLSRDPVHVYVVRAEASAMGLHLIAASYLPDGQPAAADVEVLSHDRTLQSARTNRFGMARLEVPLEDDLILRARVSGGVTTQDLGSWPKVQGAVRLTTDHTLYRLGQPIRCSIVSRRQELAGTLLVWRDDGRVLFSRAVRLRSGKAEAEVPYGHGFDSKINVAFLSPLGPEASATRAVLYPRLEELRLAAKPGSGQYRPGERASLAFQATNAKGSPVEAALGIAVVDQSVLERVETDKAMGRRRWFMEEAQEKVGGVSLQDLLDLPASKIDADYELVAEGLLDPPAIMRPEESFLGEQTSAYTRAVAAGLSDVTRRLNEEYDRTMSYPRNAKAVRDIAEPAFAAAVDPWMQPYYVEFRYEGPNAELRFISSGPDKKFGTDDDIVAATVSREWFRPFKVLVGQALGSLQDYPASDAELAGLLEKDGIRIAVLRDPWGTALRTAITHQYGRRNVEIRSAGPDRKFGTPDDFAVATYSGTFFTAMQAKIESALESAPEFPSNLEQFRDVMESVGVAIDDLRDPWGHPYQFAFRTDAQFGDRYRIYTYQQYQGLPEQRTEVVPTKSSLRVLDIKSAGEDGIRNTYDDFTVATFSRVISVDSGEEKPTSTRKLPTVATLGGRGTITGVITDMTGACVPNAEAVLADTYRTEADQNGRYYFVGVPPGTYSLRFVAAGFQVSYISAIPVRAGHTTGVDVVLQVGAVTETVTVEAAAAPVETMSASMTVAQVQTGAPGYTPRVRDYFPETLLWNPELVTDSQGRAKLDFQLADSITTWRVAVIGSTLDGRIAETGAEIRTFQPFFAELDPPQVLTIGDEIALPVPIRNYLETDQSVSVEAAAPPALEIAGAGKQLKQVGASSSASSVLKLRAAAAANAAALRVTARAGSVADAIEKPVAIHPDGEQLTRSDSDIVGDRGLLRIEIPADAIAGSVQGEVVLYPSIMAHVLESMQALLQKPYGCGEQTISSTYPNLLFLRMAKQARLHDTRLEHRARRNLLSGYQRLLGYRTDGGGFAYWHGKEADVALTSYAISFLDDAREFIEVEEDVVSQARGWLNRQTPQNAAVNGLALRALAHGGEAYEHNVVARLGELARKAAGMDEPYALASFALAAIDANQPDLARGAIDRLRGLGRDERGAIYWHLDSNTPFYGWGRAGTIETTAVVVGALARWRKQTASDPDLDRLIDRGSLFLLRSKDESGIWLSTHATIRVFGALMEALGPSNGPKPESAEVFVNGVSAGKVQLGDSPVTIDVARLIESGKANEVTVRTAAGRPGVEARFRATWYEPWKAAKRSPHLALDVAYSAKQTTANEAVRCEVKVSRPLLRGYGMMIAEIGLPPGAEVDRGTLSDLVDSGKVDSVEVAPDHVTFYVWPSAIDSTFSFTFRPRYPMRARTAASVLYDYYNPEARVVVAPVQLVVEER